MVSATRCTPLDTAEALPLAVTKSSRRARRRRSMRTPRSSNGSSPSPRTTGSPPIRVPSLPGPVSSRSESALAAKSLRLTWEVPPVQIRSLPRNRTRSATTVNGSSPGVVERNTMVGRPTEYTSASGRNPGSGRK